MYYSNNAKNQLTRLFNVSEFKCKCNVKHDTLHIPRLSEKLQELADKIGADKVVITSGYRCSAHDKAVGGNGTGQHTKGTAADCIFYKNGAIIDTRRVACYAQECGFLGIGRISTTAIHLDVRTSNRWYGDETVSGGTAHSVTSDFWTYYGIPKTLYNESQATEETEENKQETVEIRLQRFLNVTADGIIGKNTVAAMKQQDLKNTEYIKLLQELLIKRGYPCGTADGICGALTYKALHDMAVDSLI